jgi:hypothetical protein
MDTLGLSVVTYNLKETSDYTVLFPIRLDDAVMKTDRAWATDIRRTWHIGDFCHWKDLDAYQKALGLTQLP